MRQTVTVSLPAKLVKDLDRVAKGDGVSRSEVVRESLRDYLFHREFEAARRKIVPKAQARGIFTDEDVFKIVS